MAHQNKHLRQAIEYAKSCGWRYEEGGKSHKKGALFCQSSHPGCKFFVYGTPRTPEIAAQRIRKIVDHCRWI